MSDKKLKKWHFNFSLSSDKPSHPIPESKNKELLEIITQWTENNDLCINGGYREKEKPRYTLEELIAKCDPDAPMPQELTNWDNINPVGNEVIDDYLLNQSDIEERGKPTPEAIEKILKIEGKPVSDDVLKKLIEADRQSQVIKDNPDLPPSFIKGILVGLEEIKRGDVSEYVFGFDETEYLLSSPENAKRINRSIEQIEKGLAKKHDLEELAELTNKAKSSTKRASKSLEKGINEGESFLSDRANSLDTIDTTKVIKDGDDLVITLTPEILDVAGLKIGDDVQIEIDKSGFVVTPVYKKVKNE